jgi:hypothetical protein
MRRWIQKLIVVLATGYILFFYSERVFWSFLRPGDKWTDLVLGWLVYSLLAWVFRLVVRQCRVAGFPALFLAGAIFGWLAEGVVVDTLRAMTMCCLPEINTLQVDGQTKVAVTCHPTQILNFLKQDFLPMNAMCEQAEMSERGIYDRTKAVFKFFNLPFDAEPPSSAALRKVGRNEPCPCGSGLKYKKCCGKGWPLSAGPSWTSQE